MLVEWISFTCIRMIDFLVNIDVMDSNCTNETVIIDSEWFVNNTCRLTIHANSTLDVNVCDNETMHDLHILTCRSYRLRY